MEGSLSIYLYPKILITKLEQPTMAVKISNPANEKRNALFKQARFTKDPTVDAKYHATRIELVAEIKKTKSEYFQHLDPGNF